MKNIPVSNYETAMEWKRAQDRIDNRGENKKLQTARWVAEKYYKRGENETASLILRIAGQLFLQSKMKGVL